MLFMLWLICLVLSFFASGMGWVEHEVAFFYIFLAIVLLLYGAIVAIVTDFSIGEKILSFTVFVFLLGSIVIAALGYAELFGFNLYIFVEVITFVLCLVLSIIF